MAEENDNVEIIDENEEEVKGKKVTINMTDRCRSC